MLPSSVWGEWDGAGAMMTLPVVYLVYRSYNIYLTRVEEQQKHIGEMANTAPTHHRSAGSRNRRRRRTRRRRTSPRSGVCIRSGPGTRTTPSELQAIEAAALLHDIGKLANVSEY